MIIAPILLVLRIHIGTTRLLEDGAPNIEFDVEGKFCPRSTNSDLDEKGKIERAIAANKDDKDEDNL